jgi:putative membrane protein
MPYYHMMDWFPFMGFGSIFVWLIFLVIAYLVYKDAEKRGLNGLLWGLPILIPWIGIIFLILYLILREDKRLVSSRVPAQVKIEKTSLEILDERYAKGELSREQYLQMKEDINKPDT